MAELDRLIRSSGGIITLRIRQRRLSERIVNLLVAQSTQRHKDTLILQWADYHKRYWAIDYDGLIAQAKRAGQDTESFCQRVKVVRHFSRDSIEDEENWNQLFAMAPNIGICILDSVSELFSDKKETVNKPAVYSFGRFSQLCSKAGCTGVALDYSEWPVNPFVAELSTVVLELHPVDYAIISRVVKHYGMAEHVEEVPTNPQRTLRRWF